MGVLLEHRLEIGGFATRAVELEGEGPALLLLHGFADSADTWRLVMDRLRRRDRRAVALDMPGFGAASKLRRGEPILPQLDRFVRVALARFAPDGGATIAGNSLGGCAALRAAESDELGLAGVVPIAPAGLDMAGWIGIIEGEWMIRALLASPLPVPERVVRGAVGQVYRRLAFAHPGKVESRTVSSFTSHVSRRSDAVRILASGRQLRPELLDGPFRLERISCPVLVVWGDSDRMVFSSGADRILREARLARVEVIEDCGHCPQIEAPERLVELLCEFPASG
jgi:pimeloyl-ACP methyl ester carboxylesterase